jgi:hypothetical protein
LGIGRRHSIHGGMERRNWLEFTLEFTWRSMFATADRAKGAS